ncbi:MAG: UDP-2,3-diacylglucosamine diphosphatase [Pseudomonadota bacterium]
MVHYRTLFISDVHLGTRNCQAQALSDFLDMHDAETVYLVGDIVDFWRIKSGATWTEAQSAAMHRLLMKERAGARIIFIPGNHDDGLRVYCGMKFGNIEIKKNAIFETSSGRRYVVMHGDEFDVVVNNARWLAFLGDRGYQLALLANIPINFVRRRFGLGYWSLSAYLKSRVKSAVNFIGDFEDLLSSEARRQSADGIICGHIHRAASKMIGDIHYVNTGDWVESCTAVVENDQGELELINWLDMQNQNKQSGHAAVTNGLGVAV